MRLPPPGRRRIVLFAVVAVVAVAAVAVPAGVIRWVGGEPVALGLRDGPGPAASALPGCAGRPAVAPRQLRGMWLTTVNNIDWPSRPGLDQETVKAEYRGWLDVAQRLNHNAIFVHVRPSGDALWPSKYAPWSEWLTGRRTPESPGWDPLAYIVAEAHARNLEFHAWFNPYRGSQPAPSGAGPDLNQLSADHPLRAHPEWSLVYPVNAAGSRLYFDPGIPQAREFVEDSMLEAVERYDIDGVHFDDFFYPYPVSGQSFPDDGSFARYGQGFADKGDWRRDNVNKLVREMSERIKSIKPWVKFGISPFGIWRNARTDPIGSDTRGLQSYDDIYADTRTWVRQGWLDYVVPQLYWNIGFEIADYAKLLPWWSELVAGTRVQLYIGQADYRVGQKGAWEDPAELDRQLALNERYRVDGSVHFSAKSVRTDALGSVTRYRTAHYADPALVPTTTGLPADPPGAPTITAARRDGTAGVKLTWRAATGRPATGFAVYRVDEADAGPARLLATSRGVDPGEQSWIDRDAAPGRAYSYCVTGLDRGWHEGATSAPRTVR